MEKRKYLSFEERNGPDGLLNFRNDSFGSGDQRSPGVGDCGEVGGDGRSRDCHTVRFELPISLLGDWNPVNWRDKVIWVIAANRYLSTDHVVVQISK